MNQGKTRVSLAESLIIIDDGTILQVGTGSSDVIFELDAVGSSGAYTGE